MCLACLTYPEASRASILPDFLTNQAIAQTDASYTDNSQNMPLLQPASIPILAKNTTSIVPPLDINIVSETALAPNISPASDDEAYDFTADETNVYVVHKGDTYEQIAKMFGVTVDTILSVNDRQKTDALKEGDVLFILPFSAIEYTVVKGDTLESIAAMHKIPKSDIIAANIDLGDNYKIVPGEKLIIPGAGMITKAKSIAKNSKSSGANIQSTMKTIAGYFINPLPSGHKTQGIHDKYAIDIGAPIGTPIKAAASGTVTLASLGWNGAYGNVVFIKHPNGTETRYAHMSRLNTTTGAEVSQGDIIGYVGSTGRSTGPHLHFEIRGAKNPF